MTDTPRIEAALNQGASAFSALSREGRKLERELAAVTKERDQLQQWKDDAMQVEAEWDSQALAKRLGVTPGYSVRKGIQEKVLLLLDKVK